MDVEKYLNYEIHDYAYNVILAIAAIIIGMIISYIGRKIFMIFSKIWLTFVIHSIIRRLQGPINVFIPLLLLNGALNFMRMDPRYLRSLDKVLEIALTILVALILVRIIKVCEDYFYHKYDLNKADNLKERKIRTQLQFVRKFTISLIVIITAAIVLLSFESMRKIGAGLLTGVGIGGIIIGFAAQKSLGNLLAGFQIAFTQPIRIDDVVIVEGEWGRIEEITLTYVVVNIWDQRRLILPITYFIEKPFQNWTRVSAELLGTVFLYLDYTIPVPVLREELGKVLKAHQLWDQRVNVVQVTDNKADHIEVRFLMSARTSGEAFDLRCFVREHMITFIRENYPESLPRTRIELRNHDKIE
ncbi:mechanosensitive ion channel family protein [Pedobacter sp. GR22-6]|uniref:mechanosensitive ion channel family protein n=1 Tax=Pedobacter sp. GR22-6 TaxID=3127957 RepID=UPI00307E8D54